MREVNKPRVLETPDNKKETPKHSFISATKDKFLKLFKKEKDTPPFHNILENFEQKPLLDHLKLQQFLGTLIDSPEMLVDYNQEIAKFFNIQDEGFSCIDFSQNHREEIVAMYHNLNQQISHLQSTHSEEEIKELESEAESGFPSIL